MEQQVVSHYRVLERLGAGGMGVVHRALDTRLDRVVALKFLPEDATRDDEARQRFVQEAKAASALDHPNICTIHDIDTTADGQLFMAMACYEGETLKTRLSRGPLPISEAIDIAAQVAAGLRTAHAASILHRDIKPANLFLTTSGLVKILDFGIAKITGMTSLTRTGTSVGTVMYMAPEQLVGGDVDARVDLWALGAVLYEMLTGRAPFVGDHDAAVMYAILHEAPPPVTTLRADVTPALEAIVHRALARDREARHESAGEMARDLAACRAAFEPQAAAPGANAHRDPRTRRLAVFALSVLVIMGAVAAGVWLRSAEARWARRDAIPEILELIDRDAYLDAYRMAERAERHVAADPLLERIWPQISRTVSFDTEPSGADVYVRRYGADDDWRHLGQTPIADRRVPRGLMRVRVERPGFEPIDVAHPLNPGAVLRLVPLGEVPAGMVRVPPTRRAVMLYQLFRAGESYPVPAFDLDRHEVTNAQYQEFVDAGGYQNQAFWTHEFVAEDGVLGWDEAMRLFRDATGRPGPSTWSGGRYPEGQGNYPVTGVSWYEAAAYAEFAGRRLPTVYHWSTAAGTDLAAAITGASNFSGDGPLPSGATENMGPYGTYDMAGNAREWVLNATPARAAHYILGGAYSDPSYMFLQAEARAPFDRSPGNGFRTARYNAAAVPALEAPVDVPGGARVKPVSDTIFGIYREQHAYRAGPLEPVVELVDETAAGWRTERVTFNAAYGSERVTAYLFLPTNVKPPYQAILYFPNAGALAMPSSEPLRAGPGSSAASLQALESLVLGGRAVVYPVYYGTFERNVPDLTGMGWTEATPAVREGTIRQIMDLRRSLDYLETRTDIDAARMAFLGVSFGASRAPAALALDARLRTAVLVSGGLPAGPAPAEISQVNYAPRVSAPVLMLNGDEDFMLPVETAQRPLFDLLGTPADRKRHVLFSGSHSFFTEHPRQVLRDTLAWLDTHLGPVE